MKYSDARGTYIALILKKKIIDEMTAIGALKIEKVELMRIRSKKSIKLQKSKGGRVRGKLHLSNLLTEKVSQDW